LEPEFESLSIVRRVSLCLLFAAKPLGATATPS